MIVGQGIPLKEDREVLKQLRTCLDKKGTTRVTKMMFLYDNLKESDKETIDKEVSRAIKSLILRKGSYNYSESEFVSVVNEVAVHNKEIDRLIGGSSIPYFNLKAAIVSSKALKVAYDIEHGRPKLSRLERLVKLCITLGFEPYTEMFFDEKLVENIIASYEYIMEIEKYPKKVVDLSNILDYTKSSNTLWFVRMMYELNANE